MEAEDPFWTIACDPSHLHCLGWNTAHGARTGHSEDPNDDWNEVVESLSTFHFNCSSPDGSSKSSVVDVTIRETMGNGVMDSVGAHVWEAALLLCAELSSSRYQHYVEDSAVLELGSGVGLTGLYFLQLKLQLLSSHPGCSSSGSVCLSDYDHQVLRNLAACVRGVHAVSADTATITTPLDGQDEAAAAAINAEKREAFVTGKVAKLDWFDVASSRLQLGAVSFAFGSACVYNDEQAEALSNLCSALLCTVGGRCQEVVLVQVRDRPGFEQFLALLGQRGVLHEVETVAEAVYQHAASHITSSSRNETLSRICGICS